LVITLLAIQNKQIIITQKLPIILGNNNSSNFGNLDFDTIMKMKSIIDKMNVKDDPRSNLLESLKPYLKESRKNKVDQYIQLMNISRVMDVFPFMDGDNKNVSK